MNSLQDENTVVRSVIKIIRHAQYNDSITTNDIGLLLLNDTAIVKGNPNTGVMKLTNKSPEVGEECRISGFGHQTWQGEISEQLMYADVISISTARCNGTSSYDGQVLDGMICAGFMSALRSALTCLL
uniref:CSON003742 protein n=1 Tax=Culicoides sonorensis TaxID=179676 RepID=A0A336MN69_CULSO